MGAHEEAKITLEICRAILRTPFLAFALPTIHENFLLLQRLVAQGQSPYRLVGCQESSGGTRIYRYGLVPGTPEGLSRENLIGCSVQEVIENTRSLLGVSGGYRLVGFEQYQGNLGRRGAAKIGLRLPPRDEPFVTITGHLVN